MLRTLGVALFARTTRHVTVTAAGREFVAMAERVLNDLKLGMESLNELSKESGDEHVHDLARRARVIDQRLGSGAGLNHVDGSPISRPIKTQPTLTTKRKLREGNEAECDLAHIAGELL